MSGQLRADKLRAALIELGLDAFLTFDSFNQRWLTGWQQVFDGESAHVALVTVDSRSDSGSIHTDNRYSGAMLERNQQSDAAWNINADPISHAAFVADALQQYTQPIKLGIEDSLSLNRYRALEKEFGSKIELVETTDEILKLRAVKDSSEVELLKKAQAITDEAFRQLLDWIKPGQTELEVASHLEFTMRNLGAQGLAFQSIVASGPNSAKPHAIPSNRQLQDGDFVVLDFGARYLDYCADMTRTVCIGQPSAKQKDIYSAVLEAHNQTKAIIKTGITAATAHITAASILASRGYEKEFIHSLGHAVGIEVHEPPSLNPKNDALLQSGNIVTVEPGVYIAGLGGVRIEDFGLVTAEGFDSFTLSSRELITI